MHPDDTCPDGAARIPLYGRAPGQRGRKGLLIRSYAIVDAVDAERATQLRWSIHSGGYAGRSEVLDGKKTTVYLHRWLLGLTAEDTVAVDHIDRNRLNCRRGNLRTVSKIGNAQNRSKTFGSSRYRGVCWHKGIGKWQVSFRANGQRVYLGLFADEDEAGHVAKLARLLLMPGATD